jgi:integrase
MGEVASMRREHVDEYGWWEMPGAPTKLGWPGTKNKMTHRVWLPTAVRALMNLDGEGFVFANANGNAVVQLHYDMAEVCDRVGIKKPDKVTTHDLRRTFGSTVTRLGFTREAMDRILNHKTRGVGRVYDRHKYADENKNIMETVAAHIVNLAEGRPTVPNVVPLRSPDLKVSHVKVG